MPWSKDFVVIDIEATGTNPEVFDLAQLGAVKMCAACFTIYDEFVSLSRPLSAGVSSRSMAVHSIPIEQLFKAPHVTDVLTSFEEWLGPKPKGFMPVFWGCWDQSFLRVIYRRISTSVNRRSYPLTGKQIDVKSVVYHEIAKSKGKYPKGGLGLISVNLGLPVFEQHDALQDAIRTAEILRWCSTIRRCKKHPKP